MRISTVGVLRRELSGALLLISYFAISFLGSILWDEDKLVLEVLRRQVRRSILGLHATCALKHEINARYSTYALQYCKVDKALNDVIAIH